MRPARALTLSTIVATGLTLGLGAVNASATDATPAGEGKHHPPSRLQNDFDHIGAQVHSLTRGDRTTYYIDEGTPGQRVVVFIGGQGTSLESFQLTEFARSTRQQLGLRVISIERNGFGQSAFDPALGYDDYVSEVRSVLDHLDVDEFVIMAISGGGAYAAHLAAAMPERVISVHAAAASPMTLPTRSAPRGCEQSVKQRNAANAHWTHNPLLWWAVPGSPVLLVPGWQDRAYADGTRSFYLGGQLGDPSALSHEGALPCGAEAVADTKKITAPAYLYWGGADEVVPVAAMKAWQAALPNVAKATVYPGEGHTVQYRHWDQILVDMAGYSDHTVVCKHGQTRLLPARKAKGALNHGATLGLCAWSQAH
ncbi:alpha/beta fold hydrolase [Gephyromycinifex aptenodytis]|uniref:alpha/beta fold hydrolase n=1 Tax=Gephyromycinifex aptenodytis TaxID=2716227 RepID=UPI0014459C86|nr:alpha/beta hydrolase [Gephyromycinifex aptenodytis]